MAPIDWKFRPLPAPPSPVALGIRVDSLDRTRACLAQNGVRFSDKGGLWIDPADGCGAAIRFFSEEDA
jgi:hypothetical protein